MLFYIGYYTEKDNMENRKSFLSSVNKMQYIIDKLRDCGMSQQIVSCSMTEDKKAYPSSFKFIQDSVSFRQFKTFGRKNLLTKFLDIYFFKFQLITYLLKNVTSKDILLVYHSPSYCRLISFVKKIKKCSLFLEVEELYSDVSGDLKQKKRELSICSVADAFIFPTEMLNEAVNKKNKPYIIVHGTYAIENNKVQKYNDKKIHVVYAGTFDPRKGGAIAAVSAASFLNERYHLHIIGFGNEIDKKNLIEKIEKIAGESRCTVTYDGCLSGEEYIRFIQSCDIGLSTQNPDAAFNATSFPSKILSYMANGLRVVSIRIPAIETSAIGNYMYYYDMQTPEEIARAIMAVDFNDGYDGRKVIQKLDESFGAELKNLIEKND